MHWKKDAQKRVALEAVKLVKNGQIVGLGTGSTIYFAIKELERRIREENLNIFAISTSNKSTNLAKYFRIPLTSLTEHPKIDIAIDGADQVDPNLNLIKGMGGALTREKIVDNIANCLVIIVDQSKLTKKLGLNQVVPVEIIPFAQTVIMHQIKKLGGKPFLRYTSNNTDCYITDNGNNIIDVDFGEIKEVETLERKIKMIPGVLEVGLFVDMADIVYVSYKTKIKKIEKKGNST